MRRWLTAGALGGVVSLTLTGCVSDPAGTDGDRTDGRPAPTAPAAFQPQNGACHPFDQEIGSSDTYRPVACTATHEAETLHLGTFTGAHAARATPPSANSPERRAAHQECEREVDKALGAAWQSARLDLGLVLPSAPGWRDGERWFRCDVTEVTSIGDATVRKRTGSLKGALTSASPLALGCFDSTSDGDDLTELTPVACTEPHDTEYVGVHQASGATWREFSNNQDPVHQGCLEVLARYAKLPRDGNLRYRASTSFAEPGAVRWADGHRGVRCFLWMRDGKLTRSVRGGGTKVLPIRFG